MVLQKRPTPSAPLPNFMLYGVRLVLVALDH
jgi:hypothetical protein